MSPTPGSGNSEQPITELLAEVGLGNRDAEARLLPLVHAELRRLAASYMRRERGLHTLQPTALVNEAWLRIAEGPAVGWRNRAHFFAVAATAMRHILIDHARKHRAEKRGGEDARTVTLSDNLIEERPGQADVLAVDQALSRLAQFDARAARVVEMHIFGGLTFEEMAEVLGVTARTLGRDWKMARSWLRNELRGASSEAS